MDQTTLKIAIAAFIHDIGKFADKKALDITEKYILDNAGDYLPFHNGQHSHYHAVYTAAFIEHLKDFLPNHFNAPEWGEGDPFISLAAGHHNPKTPMQWAVAVADRVSSGWDADTFDKNTKIPRKDYKTTRLVPIFEQLIAGEDDSFDTKEDFSFCYPPEPVSPDNIFPKPRAEIVPGKAGEQHKALFDKFLEGLRSLGHRETNTELWFEHFESLMMLCTSSIPAARAGDVIPDVSLYDHSKAVAGLATAIYLYHRHTDTLTPEAIQNDEDQKFLIVSGNFPGIQKFIFGASGDTRKYRSKILRGRSFAVSLLSELSADMLCREIGIPSVSVILNAAGRFTIIAPNIGKVGECIGNVKKRINDWLFKVSHGETVIVFTSREASCSDFVSGNFSALWEKMGKQNDEKKFSRIDLDIYGGADKEYLDSFDNTLEYPLCPICRKRPSARKAEGTSYVKEARSSCRLCRDHVFLGTKLVKENRLAVIESDTETREKNDRLFEPLFGEYQVIFTKDELEELAENRKLLKYWDLNADRKGFGGAAVKFINGYVPVYTREDADDGRVLSCAKADEIIRESHIGDPKTLNLIACKSKNPTENKDKFCGIEALGVLKADVDNLGILMACGLKREQFTLSRLAALSRQLNFYFAVYLPHFLETETAFNDVYTVFAGGDDLFLIGPWNRMADLVLKLRDSFADYVCRNKEIHFSAGITLHKPHTPIDFMAELAEHALEHSKNSGRNRVTLFSETVTWDESEEFNRIREKLEHWQDDGSINNAMLYRLNVLMEMAEKEKQMLKPHDQIRWKDMKYIRWHSILAYTAARNVAKGKNKAERGEITLEVSAAMSKWLKTHGGKMKIPVWNILYNNR
ncbi:type III-A CRISPR-associated protein Cas10/Csm1 [Desulfococcaceae bacterium HSG8]|nr:type III-A CRISPR-associated protein Cas10/Csm1 [Desulfococcaceae bacterium HSG8]